MSSGFLKRKYHQKKTTQIQSKKNLLKHINQQKHKKKKLKSQVLNQKKFKKIK